MKRLTFALGAACLLWNGGALAQTPPSQAPAAQPPASVLEACAKAACRKALKDVVIRIDDTKFRTIPAPLSPYLLDPTSLLLFPGETVVIQFTVEGDAITGAKLLERLSPQLPAPLMLEGKIVANPDDADLRKAPGGMPKEMMATFPANVMVLSYGQVNGKPDTMLQMTHNLSRNIKFDAIMAVFGPEGYVQRSTTSCPVRPNVLGVEHWPHPIGPMILAKARLMPDGANMSCT